MGAQEQKKENSEGGQDSHGNPIVRKIYWEDDSN